MDTYLISIFFKESGPYTLEQLGKMAKERKFTWSHYVHKMGDNKWYPARNLTEIRAVLEKRYGFIPGETGPGGGMVFLYNTGSEHQLFEAATNVLAPVSAADAEKACSDYNGGGYKDWRIPTEDELRAFTIAHFSDHTDTRHEITLLLWVLSRNKEKPCAIVAKERRDVYDPNEHFDTKNKYHLGEVVNTDAATLLHVRPIRLLKTEPYLNDPALKK
jgi:hypothetical protein